MNGMVAAEIFKYVSVYLLSTVKFFGGPLAGVTMGLSFGATMALTITGMMTSVVIFSGIGNYFSRWYVERRRLKQKPIFSKHSRRIVRIWQRFGMRGIAFLTPLILSPIIGTVVATALGASPRKIILNMLWSAVFWGFTMTFVLTKISHLGISFLKH